jgi:hypothetical protein
MKYPSEQVQTNRNEYIWVFTRHEGGTRHLTNKKPNYIQMKCPLEQAQTNRK